MTLICFHLHPSDSSFSTLFWGQSLNSNRLKSKVKLEVKYAQQLWPGFPFPSSILHFLLLLLLLISFTSFSSISSSLLLMFQHTHIHTHTHTHSHTYTYTISIILVYFIFLSSYLTFYCQQTWTHFIIPLPPTFSWPPRVAKQCTVQYLWLPKSWLQCI